MPNLPMKPPEPSLWDSLTGLFGGVLAAPARGMSAMPSDQNMESLGILGQLHQAIDPVRAFGGYGNMAAMALPPGAGTMRAYRGVTNAEYGIGSRPGSGQPMYFSPSPKVASGYARGPEGNAPGVVYPAKLQMKRAYRVNKRGSGTEIKRARDPKWLKENGYDSAILYDTKNPANTEYIIPDMGPVRSVQGRKF